MLNQLRRTIATLSAVVVAFLLTLGAPATPATTGPAGSGQAGQDPADLHWAQRLGLRSIARERGAEIVDQVVLVPDAATYLAEVGRWTPDRRWPVLIEDDHQTPMFVRAFEPARVVRREPIGRSLPRGEELRRVVAGMTYRTIGGHPSDDDDLETLIRGIDDQLQVMGDPPPGVILIVPDDPAWTAALALAAGRSLPIRWLPGRFGRPGSTLSVERLEELEREVARILDAMPWAWRALGDDIDAICVCGEMSVRASYDQNRHRGGNRNTTAVATTDMIGRLHDGSRAAFAGWIFGDEARAAFVAMSSLFLPRRSAMLFNGYGDDPPWSNYALTRPQTNLIEAGFDAVERSGETATVEYWERSLIGGWSHDLIFINSGGNADFFNVGRSQRRNAPDIPVLNHPAAVHFVHSWSFRFPSDVGTVGGRFLAHGAYAFVASVEEPGLGAFMPPRATTPRLLSAVPFLVAMRWWPPEAMSRPWRVATFGDPLMTIPPLEADARRRCDPPDDSVEDLRALARRLMARANAEKCPDALAEAMRTLRLLAEDALAARLYRAGRAGGFADARSARVAVKSFFTLADSDGFTDAWQEGEPEGFPYEDMAWHLLLPRLESGRRDMALILESSLRGPRTDNDAIRLFRRLVEVSGRDDARAFMQRAIERMPNETRAKRLRDEMNRR